MQETLGHTWADRYREGRTRWERGRLNPAFLAWRAGGAFKAERVVIPGCGRAPELTALAELGGDVTGLDIVPEALDFQRKQLAAAGATARLEEKDLLLWRPDAPVDAIYEQTCLCAFPPDEHAAYEAAVRTWLRPKGRLFALFMQTGAPGGPPYDCSLSDMRAVFPADRWIWPDPPFRVVDHPALDDAHELAVVLTRK